MQIWSKGNTCAPFVAQVFEFELIFVLWAAVSHIEPG